MKSIHELCRCGLCQEAAEALELDPVTVCSVNSDGLSPLHLATKNNHILLVELLLLKGGLVEQRDRRGWTSLHVSAQFGFFDISKVLISNHADINCISMNLRTPLHCAAELGHFDIVKLLLDQGARVDMKDYLQETSLHLACSNGKEDCAELLIAHGAAVDSIDESGFTPLHKATEKRYTNIVHMLLHNRCVLNSKNKLGRTSLHGAVLKGYMDVVVQLLQSGAEANTATETKSTPLHAAALRRRMDLAVVLAYNGADCLHQNEAGQSVLDILENPLDRASIVDASQRYGRWQRRNSWVFFLSSLSMEILHIANKAERKVISNKDLVKNILAFC